MAKDDFYKSLSDLCYFPDNFEDDNREIVCPNCKRLRSDFKETGYVGCSECYKTFEKDIKNLVFEYQNAKEHVGKVPENVVNKAVTIREIERLTRLKAEAVMAEDYKSADELLQKIKSLKGGL